jgi:hypothetical protein
MSDRETLLIEAEKLKGKLGKIASRLLESYDICKSLDISNPTDSTLRELEALSARFERALDVLVRAFFRVVDKLELTDEGTILDALNRAEKRGLISSAQLFRDLRLKRNVIAHEYLDDEAAQMAATILEKTPAVLEALKRGQAYVIR